MSDINSLLYRWAYAVLDRFGQIKKNRGRSLRRRKHGGREGLRGVLVSGGSI